MIAAALKGVFAVAGKLVISYLPVILLEAFFDALDEVMETLLENAEAKAKKTPEKSDDRRLALYRKYWDGFKDFRKKKAS